MNSITKKISTLLSLMVLAALSARSQVLFQDSLNYPYTNGCIEGQGKWYCYTPSPPGLNAFVTNNTLYMVSQTTNDSVATPTNGWVNSTEFNFVSFSLNVSQLPTSTNGGYFCELQDTNGNNACHVFVDTRYTAVPGTYRLGIANFDTSFSSGSQPPPFNYPMDLAPGVNYTVVIGFDTNSSPDNSLAGAFLWINPSQQDFQNADNFAPEGDGFVFGADTTLSPTLLALNVSQIGFSPYITAGISNVIAANNFDDVNTTNLPVFGIKPESQTNYSGNSTTFYAVASAVDATYQWYSSAGALTDDGLNIIGSTSNTLTLNNISGTDYYYAIVTDAYGNRVTSDFATNSVITTPTAPFFTNAAVNLTNNLFTQAAFTNLALGTGPLIYQWYFAPSNSPNSFSALPGQNGPIISLNLADYTFAGNYFVTASNTIDGGSIAIGPTNSLTELPPLNATIFQLHNLLLASSNLLAANKTGTYYINSNNVTVSGYVTSFQPMGTSSSYAEYFIQDALGYGIQVYVAGVGNSNVPPVGTYITVSGPIEVYRTGLEIAPASLEAITTNDAPVVPLAPKLANAFYNDLSTNVLGSNALLHSCALVTLTNVYLYANKTGGAIGSSLFYSNGYTGVYMTIGQYHAPDNTNWIEVFQPASNIGTNVNPFADQPIPTNCYQLTGVYLGYGGSPEIEPSRLVDYVATPPAPFAVTITQSNGVPTVSWPVQKGSTYSVNATTDLLGSWTEAAYGLGYYPTNGAFTDTNRAAAKFYQISSP